MDSGWLVAAAISGFGIGAGVIWWVMRGRLAGFERARAEVELSQSSLQAANQQVIELKDLIAERDRQAESIRMELRETGEKLARSDAILAEREREIAESQEKEQRLKETFASVSQDALAKNNQQFLDLAKAQFEKLQEASSGDLKQRQQSIQSLVEPINKSLEEVNKQVQEIEKSRIGAYHELKEQVKGLFDTNNRLHAQTSTLVQALKSTNQRGKWGEIQLKRIVEMAGMLPNCDFVVQDSVDTEEGKRRPDLVVKLPNKRALIVDAKAPQTGFFEGNETENEEERTAQFRAFTRSVRGHVAHLASKEYWSHYESAELVVLFLPTEQFYAIANQYDPDLTEYAYANRVIIATPNSLLALMKTIAYGWRQEQLAEEAQRIAEEGKKLHNHVANFLENFEKVGKALSNAQTAYGKANTNLNRGVLSSAKRLEAMGASGKKSISDKAAIIVEVDDELEIEPIAALVAPEPNGLFEDVEA